MQTAVPDSPRERRKHEMRSRISDAAIALFADKGCESTTVEEICEQADVARKTFYNYYPSKQHLVHELSESLLFGETSNLIDLALERYVTTAERLDFFFQRVQENLDNYGRLERSLVLQAMQDTATENGSAGDQLALLNAEFLRLYQAGLEQADINGSYSLEFLAEMTVAVMNAIILNWVHRANYPVKQRTNELLRLIHQLLAH